MRGVHGHARRVRQATRRHSRPGRADRRDDSPGAHVPGNGRSGRRNVPPNRRRPVRVRDQRQLRRGRHPRAHRAGPRRDRNRGRCRQLRRRTRLRHGRHLGYRRGHPLVQVARAVRHPRRGRLRLPCSRARPHRRCSRRLLRGSARRTCRAGFGRLARAARAEGRRGQPGLHGHARRGEHPGVRHARADRGHARGRARPVHRHLGPRPARPEAASRADRGQGRQRVHPRRDASCARVPRAEEVRAPEGQLRHGLAEPAEGVRQPAGASVVHHELPHAATRELRRPRVRDRPGS